MLAGYHLLVIEVEGHSVSDEILSTGLESKLLVNRRHRVLIEIDAWTASR